MRPISFKWHRFPPDVIRYAVWLYFRFTMSLRDVEELLAQRGIEVIYETIRCWTVEFGPQIAENLKRKRPPPAPRWRLDEMVCKVGGMRMYLWRAVDDEGEVLDLVMSRRRDTWTALKLLSELLREDAQLGVELTSPARLRDFQCSLRNRRDGSNPCRCPLGETEIIQRITWR